jgi:cytochrome c oxidase assembly protein subunit 15
VSALDAVRSPSSRLVNGLAVANLVAQVAIVVTGGLVRLTGSGLGCPTWPQCVPGSYTPVVEQAEGYHKNIEFGNRLLTFVLTVIAVATAVAVWRYAGGRRTGGRAERRLVVLGVLPLLGVVAQAVLGGITVRMTLHPATVAAHFLLSMVLVAASTVLVLALREPLVWLRRPRREVSWLAAALAVTAAAVLVLGTVVTGSGPHSGDADEPARFGFDPRTVSWLHADVVWLFVGLVAALLLTLRLVEAPPAAMRRAWWLAGITVAQGAIGYVQYATDLPVALVVLHMLGAGVLTIGVTAVVVAVADGQRAVVPATAGGPQNRPAAHAG